MTHVILVVEDNERNLKLLRHPAEARLEADRFIAELERARSRVRDVEHDLAVLHVLLRDFDAVAAGVDDEMRGEAVVDHPFVHRPDQIRALLGLRRRPRYWRNSCSNSVRLAWNEGRENTSSM